jgi:AcrR family transcriptional regulator
VASNVPSSPKKSRKEPVRRTPLTREKVLQAAIRIADRQGIEALSMRRLAQALKVEAMSLYNHVDNKEAILDGIVDVVAGEIELPTVGGGDWRASMRRRAVSAHAVMVGHPWATMLFVSRINTGPNMIRYIDATIGCLRAAGFSWPMCDHIWNAIDAYTYGFTLVRLSFPLEPDEYVSAAKSFVHLLPAGRFPHMRGLTEELIQGRHDGVNRLDVGLDILLDGFERLRVSGG